MTQYSLMVYIYIYGNGSWASLCCAQILMLIILGIGLLCSVLYHVGVKESNQSADALLARIVSGLPNDMTWRDWFYEKQFYLVRMNRYIILAVLLIFNWLAYFKCTVCIYISSMYFKYSQYNVDSKGVPRRKLMKKLIITLS